LALLLTFVGFALGVSFLCSLLEAAFLSVQTATLTEQRDAGRRGAGRLLVLKQRRVDEAISAILILNTVANTLGATMAGAQAARVFGSAWVGAFSGVLTLLILVVSEIIPKTLGALYAARLASFVGHTLHLLTRLLGPALALSRLLTRLMARRKRPGMSRGELGALIATASQEGAISGHESALLSNLLDFHKVRVEDVMTPRIVVLSLATTTTVEKLLATPGADAFSRIPVYRDEPDNVVGYVLQRDVLAQAAQGGDVTRTLEDYVRPIRFVPETVSVGTALRQFLQRREALGMVADEHGNVAGLVSLEDLTETVLGAEIVDESDRVVDLRKAAIEARERRLERLRKRRGLSG
jgi:CBS domain containing-hemolysin-like protein